MALARRRKRRRSITRWVAGAALAVFLFTLGQVAVLRFIDPPLNGVMLWDYLVGRGVLHRKWKAAGWVPLEGISPHLRRAVLAGEDQRFLRHRGFDWTELALAMQDLGTERAARGASTITMQTARTLFLWSGRSWPRKVLEAYYTVIIETFWSKARILEIYLNMVDWGRGYTGAEVAARGYFGRPAAQLTAREAAALAAILPSPYRWSPVEPDDRTARRLERILKDMPMMPLVQ